MRTIPLLLSAACFALMPVLAHAASGPASAKTAPTAAAPADSTAAAATTTGSSDAAAPLKLFNDAQRAEIEAIIKDYLVNKNPEVFITVAQELQKRQTADATAKAEAAISTDHDQIYNDPSSPIGGNPKGDVTIVEFFDYQCGYCKMVEPHVEKILKEDKNIKFIYKDFPILGETSTVAAKAAMAAARQGKYIKFHDHLMTLQLPHGTATDAEIEEAILKAAKDVGLDVEKLKKDMHDDAINKIVEANVTLGGEVGAHGTPTFIIGDQVYPGALQYDDLKKMVDDVRAKKK